MKNLTIALLSLYLGAIPLKGQEPTCVPLVEINGESMLLGPITFQDILKYFDDWKAVYDSSQVDTQVVHLLNAITDSIQVLLFLGTWCSDSRHGVPPFMKTWENVTNPKLSLKIIAVDRNKTDPDNLALQWHIERVPTFVVLQRGKEIGRLVETPTTTFAGDMLRLLHQETPPPKEEK